MGGAHVCVGAAVTLAKMWGMSELVIGLTIVAIGTSLPELASSVMAAYRGHADIAIGNVLGSNIYNILCVLGITRSSRRCRPRAHADASRHPGDDRVRPGAGADDADGPEDHALERRVLLGAYALYGVLVAACGLSRSRSTPRCLALLFHLIMRRSHGR
ncbi:MAG: hypothetical protein IPH76_17950 [Xanthomonadales bacterium]|nr:hypothetical protein [Xanthomonadales bacterium]